MQTVGRCALVVTIYGKGVFLYDLITESIGEANSFFMTSETDIVKPRVDTGPGVSIAIVLHSLYLDPKMSTLIHLRLYVFTPLLKSPFR